MIEDPPGPKFYVTTLCCTSGQCDACLHLPRGERVRVLHADRLTRTEAEFVAKNWGDYKPEIEEG
jgi:hypothetical protein